MQTVDLLQQLKIQPLFGGGFLALDVVFVDVHVFVRKVKQIAHIAVRIVRCKRKADCIAERRIRMLSGLLSKLFTDMGKQFLQRIGIRSVRYREKLIAACTADKMLLGHGRTQRDRKPPDVCVTGLMAHAVVDAAQIIQVKAAHAGFWRRRRRIVEQLLALVLVRQAGRGIQIDLMLQSAVHRSRVQRLKQLVADQQHEHNDICGDVLLQSGKRGCLALRVRLRQTGRVVADAEKGFADGNDVRVI